MLIDILSCRLRTAHLILLSQCSNQENRQLQRHAYICTTRESSEFWLNLAPETSLLRSSPSIRNLNRFGTAAILTRWTVSGVHFSLHHISISTLITHTQQRSLTPTILLWEVQGGNKRVKLTWSTVIFPFFLTSMQQSSCAILCGSASAHDHLLVHISSSKTWSSTIVTNWRDGLLLARFRRRALPNS